MKNTKARKAKGRYLAQIYFVIFSIFFAFLSPCQAQLSPADRTEWQRAVVEARAGQTKENIPVLTRLLRLHPDDRPLYNDLIVVLSWDQQDQRAIDLYLKKDSAGYPDFVWHAVIKSCRRLGQNDLALSIVEKQLRIAPHNPKGLLSQAKILLDNQRPEYAQSILALYPKIYPKNKDWYSIDARLQLSQKNWLAALSDIEQVLTLDPDNTEAKQRKRLILESLKAPYAIGSPEKYATNGNEKARLLMLRAAVLLKWCEDVATSREEAIRWASRALILQMDGLSLVSEGNEITRRALLADMMMSYNILHYYCPSIYLHQYLLSTGDVPPYANQAAGVAQLELHHPERAIPLFLETLAQEPDNYDAKISLFYAYIENEEFCKAYAVIDRENSQEPPWINFLDTNEPGPNEQHLDNRVLAIQARIYGDQLAWAWDNISPMTHFAPANSGLQVVRAEVARFRGWPRRAEKIYDQALVLNPQDKYALAGKAECYIDTHEFDRAEEIATTLQETMPEDNVSKDLNRELYWATRNMVWAEATWGHSKGPVISGDYLDASAEFISVPLDTHWNITAIGKYSWGEIIGGEESFTRLGTGVRYQDQYKNMLALVKYNFSTVNRAGGHLRLGLTPDDHWAWNIEGELFADDTPLRALHNNITYDKVRGFGSYRWNESRRLDYFLSAGFFSDSNNRWETGIALTQRIVDKPRFDLDLILDLDASTNSEGDDAPYFNPKQDFTGNLTFRAEHLLHRHYDKSGVQVFEASLGMYQQKEFSTGAIGHLRYEYRYTFYPLWQAVVGAEYGQNRYDGEDEPNYSINAMIHAKF
ncbi:poly-beta-1,6 N-acetyl-D-glucosamine export porin PgaA [Desulfotalea psychrophila]|uniref:PgaA membrane beta barrel domain-containing protein n=1 Tax=Desulfotalea psychrophila (strain LSv54 / DSM 12343) TaxID=177439 RepID=Q6AMR0_DESPS|nr:poly-beta-1,6 N-acetyl-D-glucosamine export porin PgaA [Desulfotalea psychrophila]CAG36365.1 conserved hypothetical protein [Desulfotalea psychrophila LSv54]